ncbi:glycoside hydrolase family 15 protein [Candidatus Dependentiae bacterium]|nr:glycoside hydrolase family 15 protein [Candidatus Dependentiae bacterium]
MTRYFNLGNGGLLVCLDENTFLRDVYYPYVGQENHVNGLKHKFGVWTETDEKLFWLDSDAWDKTLRYKKETLVSDIKAVNNKLELEIQINDCVHYKEDIYLRKIVVKNNSSKKKEVKVFCHQVFQIMGDDFANTVYYNPKSESIIFYKGKRYFLINGLMCNHERRSFTEYSTGIFQDRGFQSTALDAQDGKLCHNPIEHGSVDSIISFNFELEPEGEQTIYYWICVGEKNGTVSRLNDYIFDVGPQKLIDQTEKHWEKWVNKIKFDFFNLNDDLVQLFKRSLLIVNTHVDKHGAFIASSDSGTLFLKRDTYAYMWPRDGALIARSLDRAGYNDLTEKFFEFCCKVITEQGYLFHKYNPDGSLGSSWHSWLHENHLQLPIQEDQIALVLDAMWKHYLQNKNDEYIKSIMDCFIRKAAKFMYEFIEPEVGLPKESYDLWEEKLGIHTFTCATVYAGLNAAAKFEKEFGQAQEVDKYFNMAQKIKENILKYLYDEKNGGFIKGLFYEKDELKKDITIDSSSVYGIFEYEILDPLDKKVEFSIQTFKKKLLSHDSVGGYVRYENDNYYRVDEKGPGNPWFITTLWLAEYYVITSKNQEDLKRAIELFDWVNKYKLSTGVLSEQLNPYTGKPLSVAPLTWSHAAYVIAVNKYLEKLDELGICKMCNPPKMKNNMD